MSALVEVFIMIWIALALPRFYMSFHSLYLSIQTCPKHKVSRHQRFSAFKESVKTCTGDCSPYMIKPIFVVWSYAEQEILPWHLIQEVDHTQYFTQ